MTLGEFVKRSGYPHLMELRNEENRGLIAAVLTNSEALKQYYEHEIMEWFPSTQNEMVQTVVLIDMAEDMVI